MIDQAIYLAVFGDPGLATQREREANMKLVATARQLTGAEIDTLNAAFNHGPLFDGDVPSKSGRDSLMELGLLARVVVKGECSYNACTNKGAWVYRCRKAMRELEQEGGSA